MVPFWAYTDSGSVPIRGGPVRSHAYLEDAVYSLNDSCSYFTNVFSLRVLLTNVQRISYYNICRAHIHIIHHIHMYICTYTSHHIHTYTCIFISSFLLLSVIGWLRSTLCVRYSLHVFFSVRVEVFSDPHPWLCPCLWLCSFLSLLLCSCLCSCSFMQPGHKAWMTSIDFNTEIDSSMDMDIQRQQRKCIMDPDM